MLQTWIRRMCAVLLVMLLVVGIMPVTYAASEVSTNNVSKQEHGVYGSSPNSFLYRNSDGTYERVEWLSDSKQILVERRGASFQLLSQKKLASELDKFGCFYRGNSYNYVVYGRDNMSYTNNYEVYRVVKYDKTWKRIGVCSVKTTPAGVYPIEASTVFDFGSCTAVEVGNYLYIATCREKYPGSDGLRHQTSVHLVIRTTDMSFDPSRCKLTNYSDYGYSSHSFNSLIGVDNDHIVCLQHGDAYPRAIALTKFMTSAASGQYVTDTGYGGTGKPVTYKIQKMKGRIGWNGTGVTVGNMEVTPKKYLVSGTCMAFDRDFNNTENSLKYSVQNVCVWIVDKATGTSSRVDLTDYAAKREVRHHTPWLVRVNDNLYYVLWNEDADLKYVKLDGNGNKISDVMTESNKLLSDCKPVVSGKFLVWYVTKNSAPVMQFVSLGKPVVGRFMDVPSDAWFASPVEYVTSNGFFKGTSDVTFSPKDNMTRAMVVTVLYRVAGSPAVEVPADMFTDVKPGSWYYTAVAWAKVNHITAGVSDTEFGPNDAITREQMATFFYRLAQSPTVDETILNRYEDVSSISSWAVSAMAFCVSHNMITGKSAVKLAPVDTATRAEYATVLKRYCMQ